MDEILPLSEEWTKAGWEYVEHAPCPDGKMRGKYLAELVPVLRMSPSHEAWVGVLHGTDTLGEWVPWTEADSAREQEKYAAERPIDFLLGITWEEAQERIGDLGRKAARKYNAASDVHMAADSAWHGLNRELFATDINGPDENPFEPKAQPTKRARFVPYYDEIISIYNEVYDSFPSEAARQREVSTQFGDKHADEFEGKYGVRKHAYPSVSTVRGIVEKRPNSSE